MSATRPLPRRLDATDDDLRRAREAAHAIAATTLGRDPGPMVTAASMSHYVHIGADVVVKLVDVGGHNRLELEIALAPHLPSGLGAPLLSSGRCCVDTCDVRYACFARMPGASPGVGLAADQDTVIPRPLIDGLMAIAENAPSHAGADLPVHADCGWSNWLADDQDVTSLLDFERARFGVPADDWVLLAAHSGPRIALVVDVIAEQTATSPDAVRAACEIRDAAFIAEDLHHALELPDVPPWMARRLRDLDRLIAGRRWWQPAR